MPRTHQLERFPGPGITDPSGYATERIQGTVRHDVHRWPSTASRPTPSRLDLGTDGPGQESEADDLAQLSLT